MTHANVYSASDLISAINTLNGSTGPHTVTLYGNDSDYVVRDYADNLFGNLAFPTIIQDISIDGGGKIIMRAYDAPKFRFFGIDAKNTGHHGKLTLSNLTLLNGDSDTNGGGAIVNDGELIITNCHFSGNTAGGYGGAIYAGDYKPVEIENSTFTNNIVNGAGSMGGAIFASSNSTLTITNSMFFRNKAVGGNSRGSAVFAIYGVTATMSTSDISCNEVVGSQYEEAVYCLSSVLFDAQDNWWGSDDGPQGGGVSGSGQVIGGYIDATNYANIPNTNYSVPLAYNRILVAEYGITRSRDNFAYFPTDTSDQTGLPVPIPSNPIAKASGSVGGPYYYPFVNHITGGGGTGSAVFISELLHLGGNFPMIIRSYMGDDCALNPPSTIGGLNWQAIGWRVCCNEDQEYNNATGSWRGHLGIVGFFGTLVDTVLFNDLVGWDDVNNTSTLFQLGEGRYVDETAFRAYVTDLFDDGPLANVETGDYVLLSNQSHGLLIVGWGDAAEVPDAINATTSSGSPNIQISLHRVLDVYGNRTPQVPYVVDFCYGYTGSETRWLQDPRPRPFYATGASITSLDKEPAIDNEDFYGFSLSDYEKRLGGQYAPFIASSAPYPLGWKFYHFPNYLTVSASDLYCSHPCEFVEE